MINLEKYYFKHLEVVFMRPKTILFYLILAICAMYLSCNIFDPGEADPEKWYMTGEAWVVEGKKKMWSEEWEDAARYFAKAIHENDSLSEAYFYIGKCILRIHKVDLNQVWDDIKPETDNVTEGNEDDIPFLFSHPDENGDLKEKISKYSTSFTTVKTHDISANGSDTVFNLKINKPFDLSTNVLIDSVFLERKRVYDAICHAIKFLEIIHSNSDKMDGIIQRKMYESDYLIEISVKTILGIVDLNHNDKLDWEPDTTGITILNERETFRILCQDLSSLDDLDFDSLKNISKNPHEINQNLDLILSVLEKAEISYDLFKTELDSGAKITKDLKSDMADNLGVMIKEFKKILPYFYYDDFKDNDGDWYDTNGNGKVDRMIWIDWDKDGRMDVNKPGEAEVHIGDKDHMKQFPQFYESVKDTKDTGTDYFQRFKFKGKYTYEFLGGDWGVDEEILDGEDNDNDSLVDEDTRVTGDTLDDDGDWINHDPVQVPDNAIGTKSFTPMTWTSVSDFYIDIPAPESDFEMVPIDPKYYLLHVNDYPTDSMPKFLKTYKEGKPYIGDFEAGDYGMDEEWYDGIDNDGDGLIDEDVGERLPPESLREKIIAYLKSKGLRG